MSVTSSTGTSLESYLAWLKREADAKGWGEVGIHITICNGQIVDVRKTSVDTEHFPLQPKSKQYNPPKMHPDNWIFKAVGDL